ncbi:MAG: HEAT repeat domain-containing protein [Planctomycetota bacterium]|nr:HEAT repeat domain-containing protein [Planctomycetota bacterium]
MSPVEREKLSDLALKLRSESISEGRKSAVIRRLGKLRHEKALPWLVEAMRSYRSLNLRIEAANSIGIIASPLAITPLLAVYESKNTPDELQTLLSLRNRQHLPHRP